MATRSRSEKKFGSELPVLSFLIRLDFELGSKPRKQSCSAATRGTPRLGDPRADHVVERNCQPVTRGLESGKVVLLLASLRELGPSGATWEFAREVKLCGFCLFWV